MRAHNRSEFFDALSKWKGPVSNIVYATEAGDIGWMPAGNFPKRVGFDGRTATARDATHFWDGYIPFRDLPKLSNPQSGFVVSANQRMVAYDNG